MMSVKVVYRYRERRKKQTYEERKSEIIILEKINVILILLKRKCYTNRK